MFRMCQDHSDVQFVFQNVSALNVQFVFLNVSDHSRCSVCVSECVIMCRITLDVQITCVSECVRSLLMFSLCF